MAIAIYAKQKFLGYIYGTVVEGIIIAATGKSSADWVAVAIREVVGLPWGTATHHLQSDPKAHCDIHPPHSSAWVMCMNG